jgi:transposase
MVSRVQHDPQTLLARIRELESRLKISEARCGKLEYKLQDLLRRIHSPKSEKLDPAQWALFENAGTHTAFIQELKKSASTAGSSSEARRRSGGGRRRAPENLPVKREVIDLPEEQKAGLIKIREEITEQIEYQPSQFYRLQIIRPVYASRTRAHAPILSALPAQVIPQAGVGVGFITHVVIAKYVDALPLYRQERIDARGGVWITRQARCRYVEAAAHLLITIHQHLKRKILDGGYVQVDETFTKLLDPDRGGRARDAYLWGYHAPHERAIVLEFSASRSAPLLSSRLAGRGADRWRQDVSGRLQTSPRDRTL